jgi:hypothetical protein
MDAFEPIIKQGMIGRINPADVESFCAAEGISPDDLYNRIALIVAERFDRGTLSYEDGDAVMNAIFILMMHGENPMESVEPAWSIYLAFDAGEHPHGGSATPVESFTQPQIRNILNDAHKSLDASPDVSGEGVLHHE